MKITCDTPVTKALESLARAEESQLTRQMAVFDAIAEIVPEDFPNRGDVIQFEHGRGKKATVKEGEVRLHNYEVADDEPAITITGFVVFVDGQEEPVDVALEAVIPFDERTDVDFEFADVEDATEEE